MPRIVTEAYLAFHEARIKALLPPPSEFPEILCDEPTLQEKIDKGAFDIVKASHKLIQNMANLDLPPELKEQFDKFAGVVAQCIPFTPSTEEIKEEEEEEDEDLKKLEPFQRTIRISFSDYAPPGWEKLYKKRESESQALQDDTLVKGGLIDGETMKASEGEANLVGGQLLEKEPQDPAFDANLVRGDLPRGSLRKGSELRESLLNGNLVGSEVKIKIK